MVNRITRRRAFAGLMVASLLSPAAVFAQCVEAPGFTVLLDIYKTPDVTVERAETLFDVTGAPDFGAADNRLEYFWKSMTRVDSGRPLNVSLFSDKLIKANGQVLKIKTGASILVRSVLDDGAAGFILNDIRLNVIDVDTSVDSAIPVAKTFEFSAPVYAVRRDKRTVAVLGSGRNSYILVFKAQ